MKTNGTSAQTAPLDFDGLVQSHPQLRELIFKSIVNETNLGIWIFNSKNICIAANQMLIKLFDCALNDIKNQLLWDFIADEDHARLEHFLTQTQSDQNIDVKCLPKKYVDPNKSLMVNVRSSTLLQSPGKIICRVLILKDETEQYEIDAALRESEFVFRSQFEHGNIGMALTTPSKGWTRANVKLCEMLGYAESELITKNWAELTHPDDLSADVAEFERLLAGEISGYEMDKRFIRKDNSIVYTHLTVSAYRRAPGPYEYVIASIQDITEKKLAEDQLKLAACVFSSSREGLMVIDQNFRIIDVNPAFSKITHIKQEDAIYRIFFDILVPKQTSIIEQIQHAIRTHGQWSGEIDFHRTNTQFFSLRLSIDAVLNDLGLTAQYACVFSDSSQLRLHQLELDRMAYFDMLTGVPNRRQLDQRLSQIQTIARANKKILAVCYIDLDGFKPINDRYGHRVGDELLTSVAQRLLSQIRALENNDENEKARSTDFVARLGGDEFALLLSGLNDELEVHSIMQRLLRLINLAHVINGISLNVSASIGITLYPNDNVDADTLLRHADHAMYQAKEQGKGRYELFDIQIGERARSQRKKLTLIENGLKKNEFCIYYQPKVNMRNGDIMGFEALIRWNHPEDGLQLPGTFLPLLEDNPLDEELGRWVIYQVAEQMQFWAKCNLHYPISINISARHLQSLDFLSYLMSTMDLHPDVDPSMITLEIVETSEIKDIESVAKILKQCIKLGFSFSLDDFGTGYSSLFMLSQLPIQEIKIDRSFIENIFNDSNNLAITQGIVGLAKAFKCNLIAEGIVGTAEANFLLSLGCDYGQGFGIARPLPASQVESYCNNWQYQPKPLGIM